MLLAKGQIHLTLMLSHALIAKHFPENALLSLQSAMSKLLLPASPSSVEGFARWLAQRLHATRLDARLLSSPHALLALENDIALKILDLVQQPSDKTLLDRPRARSLGLDRALNWLQGKDLAGISLSDLCAASAVSQRTLERAFRDNFDMSARDYLLVRRLHSVRHDLMRAESNTALVKDIALAHGFYELGRFSGYYNRLFGERPSETLNGQYPDISSPLC